MSVAEQFDTILKELPTLKAPGVSGSRIKKLTDLAVQNVSEESELITILYSNCKSTPSSHKLGILYVVDSIVRVYIEEAKKAEQDITSDAPNGTFAAGVNKITELIEPIIDNALDLMINKSQVVKIGKLVDIWERAETFDNAILTRIREKHFSSSTPPGSPPHTATSNGNESTIPAVGETKTSTNTDSGSILSALASLAKTSNSNNGTPTTAPAVPAQQPNVANATNILSQLSAMAGGNQPSNNANTQTPPPSSGLPQAPNEQYIFNMLQQMQNGNNQQQPPSQQQSVPQRPPQMGGQADYSTGRRGRDDNGANNYSRRNRSRSPNRYGNGAPGGFRERSPRQQYQQPYQGGNQGGWNQPPQQQQPPPPQGGFQGGFQQGGFPPQQGGFQQGGFQQGPPSGGPQGGPPGGQPGFAPQLQGEMNLQGTAHYRPRNVGFDQSLPQGSFKVLSRTLFIGGVPRNMGERELASVLRPFAEVQSVILNSERKHAFVKVYSRREAEQVITSFNKDNALPLRTRWGVGFGPRDCCNYQHGVSIIPIQRLTDADRSWVVQAQWGGTGGQPLSSGMVIDEPDIEIGTGISSKAMSKKMPTNSARNGPKSNRPGEPDEDYVKTTLIPQQSSSSMSHGAQPDFATMSQSSVNPLAGLFASQGGVQAAPGFQQGPPPSAGQNFGNGDGMNNGSQPNLGNQMASFFQRGMNQ
ncbi:protein Nrd1p [[Candida] anglica]